MKARTNQAGFGHIAVAFVLLFVGVVGFAGYKVYTMNHAAVDTTAATVVPKVPAKIKTQADLSAAAKVLDNSSDNVSTDLNDNALNADLNDML